jgi:hypothetical protein
LWTAAVAYPKEDILAAIAFICRSVSNTIGTPLTLLFVSHMGFLIAFSVMLKQ